MAVSLETKVLHDYKVMTLPRLVTRFPSQDIQLPQATPKTTGFKPQIYTQKPDAVAYTSKNYSRFTINLIIIAVILLAGLAGINFHTVQAQKNSNLMQNKIIEMKEHDYRLNVELAKVKELAKVEMIAVNDLQMKPSVNSKISYLILPEQVTNKDYLITKVFPGQKKLSVNIGY